MLTHLQEQFAGGTGSELLVARHIHSSVAHRVSECDADVDVVGECDRDTLDDRVRVNATDLVGCGGTVGSFDFDLSTSFDLLGAVELGAGVVVVSLVAFVDVGGIVVVVDESVAVVFSSVGIVVSDAMVDVAFGSTVVVVGVTVVAVVEVPKASVEVTVDDVNVVFVTVSVVVEVEEDVAVKVVGKGTQLDVPSSGSYPGAQVLQFGSALNWGGQISQRFPIQFVKHAEHVHPVSQKPDAVAEWL